MNNITINEIAEDYYQMINSLEQCTNTAKTKLLEKNKEKFMSVYNVYKDKYELKYSSKYIWDWFRDVNLNYKNCSYILYEIFMEPIAIKYTNQVYSRYSLITSEEKQLIYNSCFSRIIKSRKLGWIKNTLSKENHIFLDFCMLSKISEISNFNNLKKEFMNANINSRKFNLFLLKYQRKIIKELHDTGYIDMLIFHEKNKGNTVIVKDNIVQSFMDLNGELNDTLVLFTFWLNKYIKFLINFKHILTNSKIEFYILENSNKNSNYYYKNLFCFLTNINISEYNELLQKYQSLDHSIVSLYEVKDLCINLLLKIQHVKQETNYLTLILDKRNKKVLSYNNPKTNISASFHIKEEKLNKKYLDRIQMSEEEVEHQSIPNKAKKHILTKSLI